MPFVPLEWNVPQPHNLYLAFWLQTGLFGFAAFLGLVAVFFRRTSMGVRTEDPFRRVLAHSLVCAMIAVLAHGLVDTPYWKNDLGFLWWSLFALAAWKPKLT